MEEAETSEDEAVSEAETEESQVQDYAGPKQLSIQVTAIWMSEIVINQYKASE